MAEESIKIAFLRAVLQIFFESVCIVMLRSCSHTDCGFVLCVFDSYVSIFRFMHLADAFIQSDLQCIQVIHLFIVSMCVPWELNTQPFALLTQCSTTEPKEHRSKPVKFCIRNTSTYVTMTKALWFEWQKHVGDALFIHKSFLEWLFCSKFPLSITTKA